MPRLSLILPTLNEAAFLPATLASLRGLREEGHELIVADGGSVDGTPELAAPLVDRVILAPRGRAAQMNAGAAVASGEALLFLHADTRLPPGAAPRVLAALARRPWGRFDVCVEGRHPLLRLVGPLMSLRSRINGIVTGDQALFVRRQLFMAVGGFPEIPLMEDVELSRRLRRHGWPAALSEKVVTSGRKWDREGFWRTFFLMNLLRAAFDLGVRPEALVRFYYRDAP